MIRRIRPPDPLYFHTFIRNWCAADDTSAIVVVDRSRHAPRKDGDHRVEVGADWLRSQAIPREAVES